MISVEQHLDRILTAVRQLGTERIARADAHTRVLAEPLVSSVDLPPWPNSAMDGYAVHAADLDSASTASPVTLPVVGDIAAGSTDRHVLPVHTAIRIMTGAPIPEGCTAVVPIEHTAEFDVTARTADAPLPAEVTFSQPTPPQAHIRSRGEDISSGHTVLSAGALLGATQLAAAAAVGAEYLTVSRRARVAIISTGSELVPPGQPLAFGQIYDSNGPLLHALCAEAGAEIHAQRCVADDAESLSAAVRSVQSEVDVVVLTGGASVGAFDTTRSVLDAEHTGETAPTDLQRVRFDKVAMQPGKPQGFGVLDSGALVFALPGNPVSVWVSFHLFLQPALATLSGIIGEADQWVALPVNTGWTSPAGREQFMPVRILTTADGTPTIEPASARGSGSHLAATLAQASAIARVAADRTEVQPGDLVLVKDCRMKKGVV